jgi:hypothetical protein
MSANYDGRSAQITLAAALNVTGASNTNPITITVSGALPAPFFTSGYGGGPAGPLVDISGVQGNTAANGQFVATPTGASTFTVPAAGVGAYTTGGSVQPLNLQSLYTLPSDGDSDNSASIAQWGQATGDRTQFLAGATGFEKRVGRIVLGQSRLDGSSWASSPAGSLAAATWIAMSMTALGVQGMESGAYAVSSLAGPYAISGILGLDILRVQLQTGFTQATSTAPRITLFYATAQYGAAVPAFGAMSPIPMCSWASGNPGSTVEVTLKLDGWIPHPNTGILYLRPALWTFSGGATSVALINDTVLTVEGYRLTGMPQ